MGLVWAATIGRMFSVCIQPQDFDVSTELARLHASNAQVGAACFFVGLVRDRNEGAAVASMVNLTKNLWFLLLQKKI